MPPAMPAVVESELHGRDARAWWIAERRVYDNIFVARDKERIGFSHDARHPADTAMGLEAAGAVTKTIWIRGMRIDAEPCLSTVT